VQQARALGESKRVDAASRALQAFVVETGGPRLGRSGAEKAQLH
jgi:hypothetical protein